MDKEYQKEWRKTKGHASYLRSLAKQKAKANALKQELADILGGKCEICGYNKCLAALEFHHTDPSHKRFGIAQAITRKTTVGEEELIDEVKKCQLLCSNCHHEIHNS